MSTAEPTINEQLVTGTCPRCPGKLHPLVADWAYLADKCTMCGGAWWYRTPLPLDAAKVIALGHAKRTEEISTIRQLAVTLARTPETAPERIEQLSRELFTAKGGTIEGLRIVVQEAFNAGRESERLNPGAS